MNLIVDIGNTSAKLAVFSIDALIEKITAPHDKLLKTVRTLKKNYALKKGIVSSVGTFDLALIKKAGGLHHFIELNHNTPVPFKNLYGSKETLGVDRIALAAAAVTTYPSKNVLVIDAGTCITYDFVNNDAEYFGGGISPGITMRYKAINTFTARLPLLEKTDFELTGADTASSIHSGVLGGVIYEIEGTINEYIAKYQTLTVVLTGGDTNFLAKKLKSTIFANPIFLLAGLNSILIHNSQE